MTPSHSLKSLARLSAVALLCIVANATYSQNTNNQIAQLQPYEQDGVSINANFSSCDDVANGIHKEYALLAISNQNDFKVRVSFKKNIWYNNSCVSCSSNSKEYKVSVEVEPNSSVSGTCSENKNLRIFSKMLDLAKVRKLTNYELIDLNIHEVE